MCNDIDCFCYDSHEDCEKREAKWIDELTELRAVLAAMGAEKRDGVWCRYRVCPSGNFIHNHRDGKLCDGGSPFEPIPNLAPAAGEPGKERK